MIEILIILFGVMGSGNQLLSQVADSGLDQPARWLRKLQPDKSFGLALHETVLFSCFCFIFWFAAYYIVVLVLLLLNVQTTRFFWVNVMRPIPELNVLKHEQT